MLGLFFSSLRRSLRAFSNAILKNTPDIKSSCGNSFRSSHQRCSVKKVFLEISQNSQESTCARVSFLIKLLFFLKKETLAQVFSCEFYEISKNTFFTEHLWTTSSVLYLFQMILSNFFQNVVLRCFTYEQSIHSNFVFFQY